MRGRRDFGGASHLVGGRFHRGVVVPNARILASMEHHSVQLILGRASVSVVVPRRVIVEQARRQVELVVDYDRRVDLLERPAPPVRVDAVDADPEHLRQAAERVALDGCVGRAADGAGKAPLHLVRPVLPRQLLLQVHLPVRPAVHLRRREVAIEHAEGVGRRDGDCAAALGLAALQAELLALEHRAEVRARCRRHPRVPPRPRLRAELFQLVMNLRVLRFAVRRAHDLVQLCPRGVQVGARAGRGVGGAGPRHDDRAVLVLLGRQRVHQLVQELARVLLLLPARRRDQQRQPGRQGRGQLLGTVADENAPALQLEGVGRDGAVPARHLTLSAGSAIWDARMGAPACAHIWRSSAANDSASPTSASGETEPTIMSASLGVCRMHCIAAFMKQYCAHAHTGLVMLSEPCRQGGRELEMPMRFPRSPGTGSGARRRGERGCWRAASPPAVDGRPSATPAASCRPRRPSPFPPRPAALRATWAPNHRRPKGSPGRRRRPTTACSTARPQRPSQYRPTGSSYSITAKPPSLRGSRPSFWLSGDWPLPVVSTNPGT